MAHRLHGVAVASVKIGAANGHAGSVQKESQARTIKAVATRMSGKTLVVLDDVVLHVRDEQLWEHDVPPFHEGGVIVLAIRRVCLDVERLTDRGRWQSCNVFVSCGHVLCLLREKLQHALT